MVLDSAEVFIWLLQLCKDKTPKRRSEEKEIFILMKFGIIDSLF